MSEGKKKSKLIIKDKRQSGKPNLKVLGLGDINKFVSTAYTPPESMEKKESMEQDKTDVIQTEELKETLERTSLNNTKINKLDKFKTSYIENYEEGEALKFIEEQLGHERPVSVGFKMCIKVYVRPEEIAEFIDKDGNKRALYLPEMSRTNDIYMSTVGLVLSQGPYCYKGPRYEEHGFRKFLRKFFNRWMESPFKRPWCKVGDWIVFPQNAGLKGWYRGMPVVYINDDDFVGTVSDPSHFSRTK